MRYSILCGESQFLLSEISIPVDENKRSEGTDESEIPRYCNATWNKVDR